MRGGWIGVDFDGTIAVDTPDYDPQTGGPPVPLMVARVKRWLSLGIEVRMLTARATDPVGVAFVQDWCLKHIGQVLRVTDQKDYQMFQQWDDRVIQVEKNTGRVLGPPPLLHDFERAAEEAETGEVVDDYR